MIESGLGIDSPLFFIGVIENNVDERLEGRVQVRAFGIHGTVDDVPSEDLPWAIMISNTTDFSNPPLNSWVFGMFLDGRDAQQPVILGIIPTQMINPIDPAQYGWGSVDSENYDLLAYGKRAAEFGEPFVPRLARGEGIDKTRELGLETTRIKEIEIAGGSANIESLNNYGATTEPKLHGNGEKIIPKLPKTVLNVPESEYASITGVDPLAYAQAIKDIESSGGNYQIRGPVVAKGRYRGERAMGAYQVMPGNLAGVNPSLGSSGWDIIAIGRPVSEQEFMSSPEIQDKIFLAQLKKTLNGGFTYRDAASIWFTGKPLKTANPNVSDGLTSQREYIRRFDAAYARRAGKIDPNTEIQVAQTSNVTNASIGSPTKKEVNVPPGNQKTWQEPNSAYNTRYPYNRVIETAGGHTIELDDTPASERIMIYHKNGSYIQIAPDTMTIKSAGDSYSMNERNFHVYIGGSNIVTIEGDSHVLVKGNKVEEIRGNLHQIVKGNVYTEVGGSVGTNIATEYKIRAAKIVAESNVENIEISAAKDLRLLSSNNMHFDSKSSMFGSASNNIHLKASAEMRITSSNKLSIKASDIVAIDASETIELGNNLASSAESAVAATETALPEPTEPGMSVFSGNGKAPINVPVPASNVIPSTEQVTETMRTKEELSAPIQVLTITDSQSVLVRKPDGNIEVVSVGAKLDTGDKRGPFLIKDVTLSTVSIEFENGELKQIEGDTSNVI